MGALDDIWNSYFGSPQPQQQPPPDPIDLIIQKNLVQPDFSDVYGGVSSSAPSKLPGNLQGFSGAMPGVDGVNIPNTYVPPQPPADNGNWYLNYLKTVGDYALDWGASNTLDIANLTAGGVSDPSHQSLDSYLGNHEQGVNLPQGVSDVRSAIGDNLESSRDKLIASAPTIGPYVDLAANAGGAALDAITEGNILKGGKGFLPKEDVLDKILTTHIPEAKAEIPANLPVESKGIDDQLNEALKRLTEGSDEAHGPYADNVSTAEAMSHSGSDVSPESINRVASGNKYLRVSPGGEITPIINDVGAVDVKLNPGEVKATVTPDGIISVESGSLNPRQAKALDNFNLSDLEKPIAENAPGEFNIDEISSDDPDIQRILGHMAKPEDSEAVASPRLPIADGISQDALPVSSESHQLIPSIDAPIDAQSFAPPDLPDPANGGGGIHDISDITGPPPGGEGPPEIADNYPGTPKDIKYQYVGSRQFSDYKLAHENIEMRKEFGDDNLRDATFYLEGTGNPYAEKPFHSHSDVVARLNSTPQGQKLMQYIDTEWPKKTKALYDAVQSLGFADDMGYVENYIKHTWDVNDTEAKRFATFLKTSDPFLKERKVLTYEDGIARGLKPKTVNFADLATLTEKAYNDVMATHEMLDNVRRLPAMPDGLPPVAFGVPEKGEYVKVNVPQLAKVFSEGGKATYIHKDLYDVLKPVLTVSNVTKVDEALSFVKSMNLAFSLFHPATLFESSVNTFGLSRGFTEAAKGGFGVPGLQKGTSAVAGLISDAAKKAAALRLPEVVKNQFLHIAQVFGRPGMDVAEDGIMHGLLLGRPETDVMQSQFFKAMDRVAAQGGKVPLIGKSFVKDVEFVKAAKKMFDTALWDNYHNPMKLSAYQFLTDKLLEIQSGKTKSLSGKLSDIVSGISRGTALKDMSETEIKRSAAAFINDEFGGQNWQLLNNKFWSDPNTTRVLRRVFTSPDWNVSAIRAASAAVSTDPARRILGTRHYINAALGYFGFMNALNYTMSGHFMFNNEPGKKLYLETWYTKSDSKGREKKVYWQVGKQFSELHDFAVGRGTSSGIDELPIVGFLARKVLPIYQAMFAIASGHTLSGFPSEESQAAQKAGRPLTAIERGVAVGKQMGKSVLPFNVQRVDDPSTIPKLALPYPEATGMNKTRAINLLYDAYKKSDSKAASEVLDALEKNNYSSNEIERITEDAQKKALGENNNGDE